MDFYEQTLMNNINQVSNFNFSDIKDLDKYPLEISTRVLKMLIESACLSQNYRSIELGREKIGEIDKTWLKEHFIDIAYSCIDLNDEWEYRRLLELVSVTSPELKQDIVAQGLDSSNEEVREAAMDFSK